MQEQYSTSELRVIVNPVQIYDGTQPDRLSEVDALERENHMLRTAARRLQREIGRLRQALNAM
jgi:hypothetical protein